MLPPPEERRRIREHAGYSQTETAEKLSVTPRTIYRWEHGLNQPQSKNQRAYQELLREWQQQ